MKIKSRKVIYYKLKLFCTNKQTNKETNKQNGNKQISTNFIKFFIWKFFSTNMFLLAQAKTKKKKKPNKTKKKPNQKSKKIKRKIFKNTI